MSLGGISGSGLIRRRGVLAVIALLATAQSPVPPAPVAPLPRVALDTSVGRVVIELETKRAPLTAANFLRYVDQKRLDGVRFYRVVKRGERYGFVQFGASADATRLLPPVRHEPTSQTGLTHTDGVISLTRNAPGTGRGDFTISVGAQTFLDATATDPGFAAFGRVVEGMEVIATMLDTPISPTKLENRAFRGEVPVTMPVVRTARRVAVKP